MKALVTGASGQLGSALLASVPSHWDCVGLARDSLDLSEPAAIARVIAEETPDLVINAAAYTAVDRAESEEALAHAVNAQAVGTIAEALRQHGGHLVQVSTDFVFEGQSSRPWQPADGRAPLSAYGRTKSAGEDAAGPDATVVRTAWVYGAGGANFVATMLRLMGERDHLRVVADQIGAPTWASSLAHVIWALAERRVAGTFHYSDAGVASWYDFAVAIQEEAHAFGMLERAVPIFPIATADYPTPARRPAFSLLDSSATHEMLGTVPVHWRVNLRRMLVEQRMLDDAS